MLAASSATALAAVLVPGASAAIAANPAPAVWPSTCTYYTDFDFVGGNVNAYNSKVCNGVSSPAYVVIERVAASGQVTAVAYGSGHVTYYCQGTAVNYYRFNGDINRTSTVTPGYLPCG